MLIKRSFHVFFNWNIEKKQLMLAKLGRAK
jgi:hypothetical protein